jgi:RNA polymerase sigma-70 factor (ECF subfamily)
MRDAEHDLLVLDAQRGQRRALDALVRHHHADLVRYAHSLCHEPAMARDAVQEAWITVSGRLRRLDDPRAFRSWLYHAVRWRTLDAQRRRQRRAETSLEHVDDDVLAGPDDRDRRDQRIGLEAALDALPALERETLDLFYRRGLGVREIAHVQDVPAGTVKSRLFRARQQLQQTLEGESP